MCLYRSKHGPRPLRSSADWSVYDASRSRSPLRRRYRLRNSQFLWDTEQRTGANAVSCGFGRVHLTKYLSKLAGKQHDASFWGEIFLVRTVLHVLWLQLPNLLLSYSSSDLCNGSRSTNALNINSSHLPTKFFQPANLTTYTILSLFSLQVEPAPHLLSPYLDHPYLPHYKSSTSLVDLHHLFHGISSLFHFVNLILFTLLPVHLILHMSPHQNQHLRSHHLSLPLPFTPDISFTNPFLHSQWYSFLTAFTCTALKGHWRLCVLVFFLATCAR